MASRVELWNGNRERWGNLFTLDKEESVISWAWQTHTANRVKFEAAMADPENDHLRFVRLTSPVAVRRFLRAASQPDASRPDASQPGASRSLAGCLAGCLAGLRRRRALRVRR